ncbi:hypothetical protein ACFX13_036167 [Malus domestica]
MPQLDCGTMAGGTENKIAVIMAPAPRGRQLTWLKIMLWPLPVAIVIGIWAYYMRDEKSIIKGSDGLSESLYLTQWWSQDFL